MKLPRFNLANPAMLYTVIWLTVLFLVSLRFTTQLLPLKASMLILIGGNIASFWLLYFVVWTGYPRSPARSFKDIPVAMLIKIKRFVAWMLAIWAVGTFVEIVYFRGVPLLWALSQVQDKNYTDFGIPTLHGFMNALYLFSITALFLDYLVRRNNRILIGVLLLLTWPVLMLGRGILLGALCQMSAVFFIFYRISTRRLLSMALLVLVIVLAFGLIGDIRGTPNPFLSLVDSRYQELFQRLPSGFLWFYVYITSPLGNIIINVDRLTPTYVPYFSITGLFPTVIRDRLFPPVAHPDVFELVNNSLNVSTFYAGYLSDFGVAGSLIIVGALQLFCALFYIYAKRKQLWAVLSYAVLFQCLVFSPFYNLFFSQVYIMQIMIAWYFVRRMERSVARNTDHLQSIH